MKTIFDHIDYVKGKPHHIRKRVAFTAAGSVAVVVALVWLVGSVSFGSFAIQDRSFADATSQGNIQTTGVANDSQNLAGVAGAFEGTSVPAHIEIVDTSAGTRPAKKAEQTTIPF